MNQLSLYINGMPVDTGDQVLILCNWTAETLDQPAVVKNHYTQQITLDATKANDAVFASGFRLDKEDPASGFDPRLRNPFVLYRGADIIESGYCRLDAVVRTGGAWRYKVTLYGGLGDFFYCLTEGPGGGRMTLADLDWLDTGTPATEFDFTIDKAAVAAAWTQSYVEAGVRDSIWKVLNFAPCYNGIPEGDFDASRALVKPADIGLPASSGSYGTLAGGLALLNMAKPHHEWVTRDLRSYMQRPVVNVRALMDACFAPRNNGGYTVVEESLSDYTLDFQKMGLTLPQLSTLKNQTGTSGTLPDTWPSGTNITHGTAEGVFTLSIPGASALQVGTEFGATVRVRVRFNNVAGSPDTVLMGKGALGVADYWYLLIQAVMYDANGVALGGSPVTLLTDWTWQDWGYTDAAWVAAHTTGYTVPYAGTGGQCVYDSFVDNGGGYWEGSEDIDLVIPADCVDARSIRIYVSKCHMYGLHPDESFEVEDILYLYDSLTLVAKTLNGSTQLVNYAPDTVTYTMQETLHSGAKVTKAILMGGTQTPADYLLALSRMYGLRWTCDSATKTVHLWTRNAFHMNRGTPQDFYDEAVDLTSRVDRSQEMQVRPYEGTARFFDFEVPNVKTAFTEEYATRHALPYGAKMLDTEAAFSSETRDVLRGTVLRGAPCVLDRSMYYYDIFDSQSHWKPAPLLDTGCTLTLWDAGGETADIDVSVPDSACTVTAYNAYKGYDRMTKVQLMTSDGKPSDGTDVLLYYDGWIQAPGRLSDDDALMFRLTGKACWDLTQPGDLQHMTGMPHMTRYLHTGGSITRLLDMGTPAEMDIPGVTVAAGSDIYTRAWAAFMADRYGEGSKTLRCRVHLDGLPYGWEMLRRLYWYDNTLWVMTACRNYSLTTDDPAECEFVRVRDWQAYAAGQLY